MKFVGVLISKEKIQKMGLLEFFNRNRSDIVFKFLDPDTSYEDQGSFDAIIHKLSEFLHQDQSPSAQLRINNINKYLSENENTICIDPLNSLRHVLRRNDQFQLIEQALKNSYISSQIIVPSYCLLNENNENHLTEASIKYPMVCKSVMAHGRDDVHNVVIIFNKMDLSKLNYPIFVQQLIKHDGRVLKLFVVGNHIYVTKVPSIKNFEFKSTHPPIFFHSHTVSKSGCKSSLSDISSFDDPENDNSFPRLSYMDEKLFENLACILRDYLKLDLFGVDLIHCINDVANDDSLKTAPFDTTEHSTTISKYAIIDFNIFPSYKNVPNFFHHLENLIRDKLALPNLQLNE